MEQRYCLEVRRKGMNEEFLCCSLLENDGRWMELAQDYVEW